MTKEDRSPTNPRFNPDLEYITPQEMVFELPQQPTGDNPKPKPPEQDYWLEWLEEISHDDAVKVGNRPLYMDGDTKRLYRHLAKRAQINGVAYEWQETTAKALGLNVNKVNWALRKLKAFGLVEAVRRRAGGPNLYRLLWSDRMPYVKPEREESASRENGFDEDHSVSHTGGPVSQTGGAVWDTETFINERKTEANTERGTFPPSATVLTSSDQEDGVYDDEDSIDWGPGCWKVPSKPFIPKLLGSVWVEGAESEFSDGRGHYLWASDQMHLHRKSMDWWMSRLRKCFYYEHLMIPDKWWPSVVELSFECSPAWLIPAVKKMKHEGIGLNLLAKELEFQLEDGPHQWAKRWHLEKYLNGNKTTFHDHVWTATMTPDEKQEEEKHRAGRNMIGWSQGQP